MVVLGLAESEAQPMTDERLEAIRRRAEMATPGPWRDLTEEWNEVQQAYYKKHRQHYHGALRGLKRRSGKEAFALIVVDCWHGDPINLSQWPYGPDWWELRRIVACPLDQWHALYGRTGGPLESSVEEGSGQGQADREFIAHARE